MKDAPTIFAELDAIKGLPTLPAIAAKVNQMLQDYNTSATELAQVIECDQAFVPKILKLVNSAFFGFRSRVSSISHAIVLLGYNTVRNAMLSVAVIDTLGLSSELDGFDITDFWRHAVGVAVTSQHLANQQRISGREDAFTAGLLHDIGKVVMARFFPDLFKKAWCHTNVDQISFFDAEQKYLPVDHSRLGAHLATRWKLPQHLTDVIAVHHRPRSGIEDYPLALVVHTADAIVNTMSHDGHGPNDRIRVSADALSMMRTDIKAARRWFPDIEKEIQAACQFFLEEPSP